MVTFRAARSAGAGFPHFYPRRHHRDGATHSMISRNPANLIRLMHGTQVHEGTKPMTASTITTKQLAYTLAKQHDLTKKQGREMLEELAGMIRKHLKKGEQVKIAGLGILRVRNRAARVGRNPATGEAIQIKASKKVAFRASAALKMAI